MMTLKGDNKRQTILTLAHDHYKKGLTAHAFFKLHNKTTSDDLVQDTFIRTWAYLVKGGKIELMRAFLYHVLNNLIVDEYRKRKVSSLDTLIDKGFEPVGDSADRLLKVLDGKAAILLIKRLPVRYQAVMKMRYIHELSLSEMATLTGQSKNALGVKAYRGLKKLRILYNEGKV